jgi:hypothetical protein
MQAFYVLVLVALVAVGGLLAYHNIRLAAATGAAPSGWPSHSRPWP